MYEGLKSAWRKAQGEDTSAVQGEPTCDAKQHAPQRAPSPPSCAQGGVVRHALRHPSCPRAARRRRVRLSLGRRRLCSDDAARRRQNSHDARQQGARAAAAARPT
eukprot:179580-Prymnesium_polylepis.1